MSIASYISKEYKKYKRRKSKKKAAKAKNKGIEFLTKVVIFCIAFIVIYTVLQTLLSYRVMSEITPTLTTCVFAFFGTELCMCLLIKILGKKKDNDSEDESASG